MRHAGPTDEAVVALVFLRLIVPRPDEHLPTRAIAIGRRFGTDDFELNLGAGGELRCEQ